MRRPSILAALLLCWVAVACGLDPSPSPSTSASARLPSASAALTAPPSARSPSASSSADATIPNQALFEVAFGAAVPGFQFQYDSETSATVAADPGLARDAATVAVGLYTVPDQQPIEDFAIVSVLRLRDPAADDQWFRSYRDSYDTSACAQAGGVARHAESTMGTHTVFIGSCAGGAFTYHLRAADGLVVSITGVGPKRIGEQLAAAVKAR